jgi:hypothetical protein
MEEQKKEHSNEKKGEVTGFNSKSKITMTTSSSITEDEKEEIIFNAVNKIITDAEKKVNDLLKVSEKKDFKDNGKICNNEKIRDEIKNLYEMALAIFESAKEEIKKKWKHVYLSDRYAVHLGYEKKIKDAMTKLTEINRLQNQIDEINKQYYEDIDIYNNELEKNINDIMSRLNIGDRLKEKEKEKMSIKEKKDKVIDYLRGGGEKYGISK